MTKYKLHINNQIGLVQCLIYTVLWVCDGDAVMCRILPTFYSEGQRSMLQLTERNWNFVSLYSLFLHDLSVQVLRLLGIYLLGILICTLGLVIVLAIHCTDFHISFLSAIWPPHCFYFCSASKCKSEWFFFFVIWVNWPFCFGLGHNKCIDSGWSSDGATFQPKTVATA